MSFRKWNLACLMFTGVKKWPTKQHCGQPTIKVTQCTESYSSWRFQQIFLWSLFCCIVCRNSIICHRLNNAYRVNKYFTKPRSQHGSLHKFSFCHVAKTTIRAEDENIFMVCSVFNPSSERWRWCEGQIILCVEWHELQIRSSANTSPVSYTTGGSLAASQQGSMCYCYTGRSNVHFLDVMCSVAIVILKN